MNKRVNKWIKFAEEDLKMATMAMNENIFNQVCFHSQQCVEKCLKAIIESKTKVPKEHSLLRLLNLALAEGYNLEDEWCSLDFLDNFYTSTRYPFVVGMVKENYPEKQDADRSLTIAQNFYKRTIELLSYS